MTSQSEILNVFENPGAIELSARQEQLILPSVLEFLNKHKPRVGEILLGRAKGPWTKRELHRLERVVCDEVIDVATRADFLRLLRNGCRGWVSRERSDARLPAIPVIRQRPNDPFRFSLAKCRRIYDAWKRALAFLLLNDTGDPLGIETLLTSAVLYGGLLDFRYLVALLRAFAEFEGATICARKKLHIELWASRNGRSRAQLFRWQPDLLSGTLWMSLPPGSAEELLSPGDNGAPCNDKLLVKRISALINAQFKEASAPSDKGLIRGIHGLLQAVEVIAHTEMPALVVNIATGRSVCHSVRRRAFERLMADDVQYLGVDESDDDTNAEADLPRRVKQTNSSADEDLTESERRLRKLITGDDAHAVRCALKASVDGDQFFVRMKDFADYLLAIRANSGKMWKVSAVRQLVTLICHHLEHVFQGHDPVESPTEDLERQYVCALESAPEAEQPNLARAVLWWHRYFVTPPICKEPLENPGFLRQFTVSADVDANFVLEEELPRIFEDIRHNWPVQFSRRKEIGELLIYLGREGFRREEARRRKINDVLKDLRGKPQEILIRPDGDDKLKSRNAKRRNPFALLATDAAKEKLFIWLLKRDREQATGTDYLFTDGEGLVPESIFLPLNDSIAVGCGDPRAHFHGLRHALACFGLTGLLLGSMENPPDLFPHLPDTSKLIKCWGEIGRAMYGHSEPTRKHAYMMTRLLGHGSPATMLTNYYHLAEYLLIAYLNASKSMKPELNLVKAASRQPRTTVEGWIRVDGPRAVPVELFRIRARRTGTHTMAPVQPKPVASAQLGWEPAAHDHLWESQISGRPFEEVAHQYSLDVHEASDRQRRAEYLRDLRSGNGLRHRLAEWPNNYSGVRPGARMAVPRRPELAADVEVVRTWSSKIDDLARSREYMSLTQRALDTYIHRVWHEKDFAVFHSINEADEARAYLQWLLSLGIKKQNIRFGSFSRKTRSQARAMWRSELSLNDRDTVECISPPNAESVATESWFGIAPKFSEGQDNQGSFGFRYLMCMAYIVFGASPLSHENSTGLLFQESGALY